MTDSTENDEWAEKMINNLPSRLKYITRVFGLTREELASRVDFSLSYLDKVTGGDSRGSLAMAVRVERLIDALLEYPPSRPTKKLCEICGRDHYSRGLCKADYRTWTYHRKKSGIGLKAFIEKRKVEGRDPRGRKRVKP